MCNDRTDDGICVEIFIHNSVNNGSITHPCPPKQRKSIVDSNKVTVSLLLL